VELDLAKSKNRYERARLIEGVISYCHKWLSLNNKYCKYR
jgi:hypothetical protein